MATINRILAEKIVKGNGKCKEGTAGYVLVRYQNRIKYDISNVDLYDPDAKVNCFDYAIFANERKYLQFLEDENIGGVDILWGSKKFYKDEQSREEKELLDEAAAEFIDLDDILIRPRGRERI